MAGDWTDWADGSDLSGMSRAGDVLGSMGYSRDDVVGNPAKQAEVMDKVRSPYAAMQGPSRDERAAQAQSAQMAQNTPPQKPTSERVGGPASQPDAPDPHFAVPGGEPSNPTLQQRAPAQASVPDTVGAAAMPAASPAAPNPAAPAASGSAPWTGYQQRAIESELGIADANRDAYQSMQAAPDTKNIDATIETESIPTDPRETNPMTGKRLYKEGFWGELGRAGQAFARGGTSGVVNPASVGVTPYGAPNSDYTYAEQQRQGKLAQDQQRKTDLINQFKTASDAIEKRAQGRQTAAPDYEHVGTMATAAENAQTEQQKAATEQEKADQASPAGKAALDEAEFKQYSDEANRLKLTGMMRSVFIGNRGKMPDPRQATAEEISRAQALKTFIRQNGHAPQTLDEINQVNAAAGGRLKDESGGGDTPPPAVAAAARDGLADITKYTAGWERQPDGKYRSTDGKYNIISGNEFDAQVNALREKANKGIAKNGWQIDRQGQVTKINAPAASPAGPRPGDPVAPAGATHAYRDKQGTIRGWAIDGKYVPVAQGAR